MTLHPELVSFERRLQEAGVVAALHADHVCVRLPLLTSVRVRYDGARLTFDPRFGASSRTASTATAFVAASSVIVGMAVVGTDLPVLMAAGTISVLASAYDVMRYIVTESAISRVMLLWSGRHSAETVVAIGSGPARPVRADAGAETVRAPLHVE